MCRKMKKVENAVLREWHDVKRPADEFCISLTWCAAKETRTTYMMSSRMEIPPSFNMGVTSSARYNQIWGISMAMSSAVSNVSEKLREQEKNHMQM